MMNTKMPKLNFKLVGKFIDHLQYNKDVITVVGGEDFLTRHDYEEELSTTSWLLYLYEDRNYELIASGAFLDAVLYNKPIICLKNNFFKNILADYEIGIMVDSIEEFPSALECLFSRKDLQEYYIMCQVNIKRYLNDYQLNSQVELLKEKIVNLTNS
ncbi:hypothetical protein D3C87_1432620 [compost metagenome]